MTEWGYNHWLADLKKTFNGFPKGGCEHPADKKEQLFFV
jgi:hypothetical protein